MGPICEVLISGTPWEVRISNLFLIGSCGVRQFVAVRIDIDQVSEGVFAVHHAVGFFARVVLAHRHSLFAAVLYDLGGQAFDVRILHTIMKDAGFPVPASPVGSGLTESCSKWLAEEFSFRDGF